jgi:hypothetical protein
VLDATANHVDAATKDPKKMGKVAFGVTTTLATGAQTGMGLLSKSSGATIATARATEVVAKTEVAVAEVGAKGTITGAESVNASAALRSKLSALEDAQASAANTRTLPDGRVRYYGRETPSRNPGPTRGASYVTEHNPATGGVRSWMETYNQAGEVNRVHPKMKNGQQLDSQHYPPTAKELGL